ncbi:MAG: hypothetical protein RI894_24 [Bacteroidota bacterium]|jgi:D-alanyl-D-alanine carboxypeptidase
MKLKITSWAASPIFALLTTIVLLIAPVAAQAQMTLDSMLNRTLDSMKTLLNVKSLSAAMQLPDAAVWSHAKGISGGSLLATPDKVYLIGSVTKTMTSACILQLAEQNVLNLDDSLSRWVSPLPTQINPNITIRQLLRHQSGIYDVLSNPNCQPALQANMTRIWQPEELITAFIGNPVFAPGTDWQYSNTNYMLLAMIIKQATGNPFHTELRNRFFTPLTMNTIAIPAFETLISPVAHIWIDLNGDGVLDNANSFYMGWKSLNSAAGAAGGYFATPSDVTRWMRTYMRGDLLSAASMAQAKTTVMAPGLPGASYGLGLMKKSFIGYEGYGHGGDLSYTASSWYFPAKDVSITVFANDASINSWALAPVIAALLKTYTRWQTLVPTANFSATADFTAYPNPFSDNIAVNLNAPSAQISGLKFSLYNALGELVAVNKTPNFDANNAIFDAERLAKLPAGIYFLNIDTPEMAQKTVKMVKK